VNRDMAQETAVQEAELHLPVMKMRMSPSTGSDTCIRSARSTAALT
jgi:hypothetical protein